MRKTALLSFLNGVAAIVIWIASTILGPAHGQHGVEVSTFELFPDSDSVDPKPDAIQRLADTIRNAQPPGKCPLGRLKIRTPEGDKMFQEAVAAARQRAVLHVLNNLGVPVAGRLFIESTVFGESGGHDTVYEAPRDRKPPKLNTTSVPRKGSKVKAGDQITVTMIARDDPDPWPTGIKTIQLVAESDGGRFIASENYEPCAEPAERRVVATYVVPSNPPPLVRLTGLAEDFVGLMDNDVGEFPTRERWQGSVKLESDTNHEYCSAITSETLFTIDVDDNGEVSGSGTFDHSGYTCETVTTPATHDTVKIGGKKQAGTFTIFLSDWDKNAIVPRLPVGQWTVAVGEGTTGENSFATMPGVVFRVKLECQTCKLE